MGRFMMKLAMAAVAAVLMLGTGAVAQAQSWTQDVDWAARNTDAGGSVDCPMQYVQTGEEGAIAIGGRSTVINDALFAAYGGNFGRAYQLVLMTQCHNPEAQGELLQAGQNAVIKYLVNNWTPTGVPSSVISQGVEEALEALAGS